MTITAKIVADSISEHSPRLVTVLCRYPKFIHSELMTHRVFSRNASSSRAIPVERLIQDILNDPVNPSFWGANQAGMQAANELDTDNKQAAQFTWDMTRENAIAAAKQLVKHGAHKQIANRVIEPFSHINVVITSTEWSNFFALRRHKDAQPEMHALADAIYKAMEQSTLDMLEPGQWHLPFVTDRDWVRLDSDLKHDDLIKLSVARCARTSYMTHEGKEPNIEDDLKLYDRLVGQIPLHASPCEHQATPDTPSVYKGEWMHPHLHGNFVGWKQHRKQLPGESQ